MACRKGDKRKEPWGRSQAALPRGAQQAGDRQVFRLGQRDIQGQGTPAEQSSDRGARLRQQT